MYSSVAILGFTVLHKDVEPTKEELERGLRIRYLEVMRSGEIEEACLPVDDTEELEDQLPL